MNLLDTAQAVAKLLPSGDMIIKQLLHNVDMALAYDKSAYEWRQWIIGFKNDLLELETVLNEGEIMTRTQILDALIKLVEDWYTTETTTGEVVWGECARDLDNIIEKAADKK
jgi:hypothetical protein